jgi:hypothetical protein
MHTGIYCGVQGIRLFLFLNEQIKDIIHSGRSGGIYIIREALMPPPGRCSPCPLEHNKEPGAWSG